MAPNAILFLPGTGVPDAFYRPLLDYLSQYGEVVRWVYRHRESMVEACRRLGNQTDLYGELRSEVCFGPRGGEQPLLGLNRNDAISAWFEERMQGSKSSNVWKQTVVVGHSQGAGHALLISQKRELAGAVMIAGPADATCGSAAGWSRGVYATPSSRRLVMVHAQDAGYRGTIAHALASGLTVRTRDGVTATRPGGHAVVETAEVPPLSAHGCLAGSQTWGVESPLYRSYHGLVNQHLEHCLQL